MQLVRPVAPNPSIELKKLFTLSLNCRIKLKHDEVKSTHSHLAIWVKKALHNALCWTLYILLKAKVKKRPKLKKEKEKYHTSGLCVILINRFWVKSLPQKFQYYVDLCIIQLKTRHYKVNCPLKNKK